MDEKNKLITAAKAKLNSFIQKGRYEFNKPRASIQNFGRAVENELATTQRLTKPENIKITAGMGVTSLTDSIGAGYDSVLPDSFENKYRNFVNSPVKITNPTLRAATGGISGFNTLETLGNITKGFLGGDNGTATSAFESYNKIKQGTDITPAERDNANKYFQDQAIFNFAGEFGGLSAATLKGLDSNKLSKELVKRNAFSNVKDKGVRFFISSKQANLKRQGLKNATERGFGTLDEILNHPKLFKEYPQAKNINVQFDPNMTARGSYDEVSGVIKLNPNNINFEQLGTILHENQHFIQGVEGFAKGTSPATVRAEREKIMRLIDGYNKALVRANETGDASGYSELMNAKLGLIDSYNKLGDEYGTEFGGYTKSLGEAEARTVQGNRGITQNEAVGRDLLSEQLQKEGIKPEEVIVKGGRTPSFSEIDPLIQEARKYKSAEEFVKAQSGTTTSGGYTSRGLKQAIDMRKEGGSLADYDIQARREWLGGKSPTGEITLYRATPNGEPIRAGNYVTNDINYAKQHIRDNLGGKGKLTEVKATLDDIFPADAPKEFWYAPKEIEGIDLTDIWNKANSRGRGASALTRPKEMGEAYFIDANGRSVDVDEHLAEMFGADDLRVVITPNELNVETRGNILPKQAEALNYIFTKLRDRNPSAKVIVDDSGGGGIFSSISDMLENRANSSVMEDAGIPSPLELLPPPKEQKLLSGGILEAKTNAQAKKLYKQTGKTPTTNFHKEYKRVIRLGGDTPPSEWDINQMRDIGNLAKGFKDVYRNFKTVFGAQFPAIKSKILDPFDASKGDYIDMQTKYLDDLDKNIVSGLGIKKGSKESALVQQFGEKKVTLDELQNKSTDWQKIVDADKYFRMKYDELIDTVNNTRKQIYPNSPEKLIQKRQDYYRHFKEMNEGLGAVVNIFETPASIDPNLAGISDFTKPKSKFLSIAQQRTGDRTEYDAVGGYLNYLRQATYATHMDPQIEKFRKLREQLVTLTEQGNVDDIEVGKLNNFIEYLNDYSNALAGKSTPIDRAIQKYIPGGRTAFKALGWLNSRVKANVIVGNFSSALAQLFNTPQAIGDMGGIDYTKGTGMALANILNDDPIIKQSTFIKERYFNDYAKFDVGMLNNVKKFAVWVTGVADELATKNMWYGYYSKGLKEAVENPVKFADDATRRMTAGRGVGEVPIMQTEKTFQLIAPFQVEVSNLWNVFGDWAQEGGPTFASKMVKYSVAAYLMNQAVKEIRGSDVTFDPINATIEGAQALKEEENKRIGAMKFGGRILGEVLSNAPLGQSVAAVYPEYGFSVGTTKYPTREDLFGEGDPTKYGSGLLVGKGLQDPLFKILSPFGGAQIKKTLEGQQAINRGYSQTDTGRVRYPISNTPSNRIKGAVFGQYAVEEGQNYFDTGATPLGSKQSEKFKQEMDQEGYYKSIMDKRERNRLKEKAKQSGDIDTLRKVAALEEADSPIPKTQEQFNRIYTKALKDIETNQRNIDDLPYSGLDSFDSKDKRMLYEEKLASAQATVEKFKKQAPEKIKEAEYNNLTKQTNEVRAVFVNEEIQSFGKDQRMDMLKTLAEMRKVSGGKMLLSDTIITDLIKDGILTKDEGNQLKSLKIDENGQVKVKVTGRGKGAKLKKIKFVPINAVSKNKIKFENASKFTLQAPTSLKVGSISTPKIDLPKLKVSSPESPKFKVKFNL